MKPSLSPLLLSSLGFSILASAQLQTIVALDKKEYQSVRPTPTPAPTGSNIEFQTDDGLDVYLGPDLSKKVTDAYKSKCKSGEISQDCIDAINGALGVGPEPVDGLQKRIIDIPPPSVKDLKAGIAGAASFYAGYLAYLWKWLQDDEDPSHFTTLHLHIPPIQTSSIDALSTTDSYVWATKSGDPGYTVSLAAAPTPAADKTPSTEEKDSGAVMHLPDLGTALQDATKGIVCKRQVTGTSSSCVIEYAEAIVKAAQAAGGLASLIYLKKWVFPEPKNELLVTSLKETTDFASDVYLGPDVKVNTQVATAATWISWGYLDQKLDLSNEMTFTAMMLKTATATEPEDQVCKDGPNEEDTPFCDNCNGNANGKSEDGAGEVRGVCVGFENDDYFKGCPCFVREVKDGATGIDLNKAFQAILDFSDPEPEPEPTTWNKICFKQQDDVRKDTSKWKWSHRDILAQKIEEFCGLEFNKAQDSAQRDYETNTKDSFRLIVRYKGIDPPDRNTCIWNLRDQIVDGCDADKRLNQHNLKWGGRSTYKPSGMEFEVAPLNGRVATSSPNWECATYANRGQKDNKGRSGAALAEDVDDRMMKEMCVHELYTLGWRTDSNKLDCGGDYNIVLTGSVSRNFNRDNCSDNANIRLERIRVLYRLLELQLPVHFGFYSETGRCGYDRNPLGR
jgi:hypothetical protein